MKRIFIGLLCGIVLVSFGACGKPDAQSDAILHEGEAPQPQEQTEQSDTQENSIQISNPMVPYDTREEGEEAVGFSFPVPEKLPEGWTAEPAFTVISEEMAQVMYQEGENRLTIRKAKGTEDISGDYTEYPQAETFSMEEAKGTLKGGEDIFYTASWTKGEYTYALTVSGDTGMDRATLENIIGSIA